MKKTLFYLIAILIIVSCSKDDSPESASTFLETYDNTVWKFEFSIPNIGGTPTTQTVYIRFKNNLKEPFGYWVNYGENPSEPCFDYFNFGLESITVDIIENSKDSFIMRCAFDSPGNILTFSFVKKGDSLGFEYKETENGRTDLKLSNGVKSTINVGSLKICN